MTYEEMIAQAYQQGLVSPSTPYFPINNPPAGEYHILPIEDIQGNPYAGYNPATGISVPTTGLVGQDPNSPAYSPVTNLPGGEWSSPASPGGLKDVLGTPVPTSNQTNDMLERLKQLLKGFGLGGTSTLTTLIIIMALTGKKIDQKTMIMLFLFGGLGGSAVSGGLFRQ